MRGALPVRTRVSTAVTAHIARWDLDKTYLRTEFDTLRDLVRTALERPDEKRTNPGASTLLREMVRAGIRVHILSGSPEQMRRRLEDKLRLDGITWDSFTLKPNLQNLLRLRFRAVRDQLGYKLPALLRARASVDDGGESATRAARRSSATTPRPTPSSTRSTRTSRGRVGEDVLLRVLQRGRVYEDVVAETIETARRVETSDAVERILIHLERQTPPDDFRHVRAARRPLLQLPPGGVRAPRGRPARRPTGCCASRSSSSTEHRFDGDALARSYLDLARRGHLRGTRVDEVAATLDAWLAQGAVPASDELRILTDAPAGARGRRARRLAGRASEARPGLRRAGIDAQRAAPAIGVTASVRVRSHPGVVEDLADAAGAGDDVLVVVEAALLVPARAGHRRQHVGRAEAAVERGARRSRVSGCAREDVAQVLGRHDEVHRDAAARACPRGASCSASSALIIEEPGRAHRIGEEHDAPVDVAADLRVVPRRAVTRPSASVVARHEEVVLPHARRVEQLVQQLVDDLRRHRARRGRCRR